MIVWKAKYMHAWAIISVTMLLATSLLVGAQGFQQPIHLGSEISNLAWSPDSQSLVFFDGRDVDVISSALNEWYQYDLNSGQLTLKSHWPLHPQLTSSEIDLYRPYVFQGDQSFVYVSPNDAYIAYATGNSQQSFSPQVMLAKRQTQEVAETYVTVWEPHEGADAFEVLWNRTSTAFVVNARKPGTGGFIFANVHVGGFSTTVTSLRSTVVTLFIGGNELIPAKAYSVSDDGNFILLKAYTTSINDSRLVRWDVANKSSIFVDSFSANQIVGASFDQGNPDRVLLVYETGVVRHTISTGQTTLLNSQLNAYWAFEDICCYRKSAVFSSNGQWLAVARGDRDVYVFDLLTDFVPTPTFSAARLKVQYYPESTTRTTFVESIIPTLNIVNATSSPVNLSELMIRYYFRSDQIVRHEAFCAWTALPGNCASVNVTEGITHRRIPLANGTADAFITVRFTSGVLPANSQTGEIIVRTNKVDWSDFDQSNDYSFDPTSTSDTFKDWEKVVLYRNGNPIWGIEPQ
jgi:hypothetical protein